ncbi:MAG: type II toxin-antitoxin system RelE/ParE family toxin [Pigmentiphaga sp.]|nr:type II toxin-antitoxin system RelE/ParE family toxin [Pigmentiphaga sp.]
MTRPYVLTRGAAADLRGIVRYTIEQWGEAQCKIYIAQLEAAGCELAKGQGPYKKLDDLQPGLRVRLAGRHYLFCLPRTGEPALLLAILHERMDIMTRLKSRLG